MYMDKREKKLREQNEFLKDLLQGFEDAKAGRTKPFEELLK